MSSSTRQSINEEDALYNTREHEEMRSSNSFNNSSNDANNNDNNNEVGRESSSAAILGDSSNTSLSRQQQKKGGDDNDYSRPTSTRSIGGEEGNKKENTSAKSSNSGFRKSKSNVSAADSLLGGDGGGGGMGASIDRRSAYLNTGGGVGPDNIRASQVDLRTAVEIAIIKATEEEEKAKKLDEKRTEVRSVLRNLYILFKYTNVGGLMINYLKPIPKGTQQAERIRRTQIISQAGAGMLRDGGDSGGGDSSDELSLANPPPLRKSWKAAIFILFLIALEFGLSGAYAWAYNHTSDHVGDVLYAITEDDRKAFDDASLKIVMAAFIGAASNALYLAIGDFLVFDRFREALTYEILVRYMSDHTHFYLVHLSRDCDDPSGRITADVEALCDKLKMIVFGTPMFTGYITTTATVAWFTYTLVEEYGWFLMTGALVFFVTSVVLTMIMSYFPTKKMKAQKEAQSNFSAAQHYFAAHSEHVAFLRGESAELAAMMADAKKITVTTRISTLVGLPLNFTTIMFYWGVTFFSALIPGFGFWWTGEERLTGYDNLSNAVYCIQALMNTMTTYILLAQEYSQLAAVLQRITELILAMQFIEEEYIKTKVTSYGTIADDVGGDLYGDGENTGGRRADSGGYYRIRTVEKEPHSSLEIKDVTLFRPNTQNTEPLIEHLSFSIGNKPGEGSLLIMGPSGVGKSSLLRVIAGLWPAMTTDPHQGGIYHPPVQRRGRGSGGMMFLPQRPYLIQSGSLAAQIMYPMTASEVMTDLQIENYNYHNPSDNSLGSDNYNYNNNHSGTSSNNDRGPLMDKSTTDGSPSTNARTRSGAADPLAGLDEAAIVDLKKEIFALLVKVRLGHVARRYSEADWFGIVKPEVESDDEDDEVAFKAKNKNRLSVMPATALAAAGEMANGGDSAGYGATYRQSISSASRENAAAARLTGAKMTVDMSSCTVPWDNLLSVGEQQRLAIARVLFHRPHIAIVDEATSAMDEDSEVMCLQAIKDLGIKMLSVAHRSTVKAFHERLLLIKATGGIADDADNPELPPPLPLVNRTKQKISYEIVDL